MALDYEKERKKLIAKHTANVRKWNKENPDKRISGTMPEGYEPTPYRPSVTQSNFAKTERKKLNTGTNNNAPMSTKKGVRKKTSGSRISNTVKGTAKQVAGQYLNAAATMSGNVSNSRLRREDLKAGNERYRSRNYGGKNRSFTSTAQRQKQSRYYAEKTKELQKNADLGRTQVQNAADKLSRSGSEDIEKAKEGLGGLGRGAIDLSSQLLMWGSDAAIGAATGGSMLAPMFVRAFGGQSMSARESGADKGEQIFAGLAAGGVEAATEKLFSPYKIFKKTAGKGLGDNLTEKVSYSIAEKVAQKLSKNGMPNNALYKAVRGTVKAGLGMIEEGSEEAIADLAQPLYERVYDKDALKQYGTSEYWKGVGTDFAMGAAMAGVLGGGSAAVNRVRSGKTQKQSYDDIEKTQAIEAAKAQGEDTQAYKYAVELEEQRNSGKEILDAQIDDLAIKTFEEELSIAKEMQSAESARIAEIEQTAGNTDNYISDRMTSIEADKVNEIIALRVSNNAKRIEQNLINVFHVAPEAAYEQAESIARIKTGTATPSDFAVASVTNIPGRAAVQRELGIKLPATNAETQKRLAEYEGITRAVQKQNILKEAKQSARAELFQMFTSGMDDVTADVFADGMEKIELADMPKYMEAFATYYEGGRVNFDYAKIPIAQAYKDAIPTDIRTAAYNAGNQIYLAEKQQAKEAQKNVVKEQRRNGQFTISEENEKKIGKTQANALRMTAEVTGKKIVVLDQIDAKGREDVANGKYQDGVIYISAKSQTPVFDVMKHELTHNLQETAPEAYQELKDYVFKKFYEADRQKYSAMVDSIIRRYAKSGVELTQTQAEDELLADATDVFFKDYDSMLELVNENRSLGEKLLDGIRALLDTFHRIATGSYAEENASRKGEWLKEIGALEEAERLWVKALNDSIGAKPVKSGERFSMKSVVEETKDLIAVHGTSEQKLMKSLNLGGFPMPSIAIIRDSYSHSSFGDITLLFAKKTIDPQANADNKVYTADAYTPMYPKVEYKTSEKVSTELDKRIRTVRDLIPEYYKKTLSRLAGYVNLNNELNSAKGEEALLKRLSDDYGMKQMFLAENNSVVPMQQIEERKEMSENDIIEIDGISKYLENPDNPSANETKDAYVEWMRNEFNSTDEQIDNLLNNTNRIRWMSLSRKVVEYRTNGSVKVERKDDIPGTNKLIDDAVNQTEYDSWLKSLLEGVEEGKGIYNGKEYLTPSGNRRSFEQLHYTETLENVVKVMKEGKQTGQSMFGRNILGAAQRELESVGEINASKERLKELSEDELYELRKDINSRFLEIAEAFSKNNNASSASELLIEAIEERKTKSGIANYLKREGNGWTNYSDWIVDDLLELVHEVSNMPTQYFEAKPQRAVRFNEIKATIIPKTASKELKEALNKNGVNYVEYDGTDADRLKKINSAADSTEARFQIKDFEISKEQVISNMKEVTDMKPIAKLYGEEFSKSEKDLITQVSEYFDSIGNSVKNNVLGDVELNRKGAKSSMAHGIGRLKAAAFMAVPDVIRSGKIIDAQHKWKERNYDTVVLAAPITIQESDYYVALVINRDRTIDSQRYYLHEVGLIKKNSLPFKTSATQLGSTRGGKTAPMLSLLQQLNSVNELSENDITTDEGRFQLKDETDKLIKELDKTKALNKKLKAEFKRTKISIPNKKEAGRAVTKLMDTYIGKRLPKVHESIMKDVNQVFAEMRKYEGNWNLVDDLCKNVADKIVSNMEVLHDEMWTEYSDLRKTLRNTTLRLDEEHWNDITDFNELRKSYFGTLNISKNKGVSIDTFYQELSEEHPELFNASEYTNEVDQLYNIIDVIDGMRPYTEDYSAGEIAEFADNIASEVLQMSYDLSQQKTFADIKFEEKTAAIEKVKAERNAVMERQRKRLQKRLDKKDEFYKQKIKDIRSQYKDRKERKYYTSRIEAYSQWLSDSLLRPSETKHIPNGYQKAVASMLSGFDFSTTRTDNWTAKFGPSKRTLRFAELRNIYEEIEKQEVSDIQVDDETLNLIKELQSDLDGKRFDDLDTEQLAKVYELVKRIRFAMSHINKAFSESLKENISDYASRVIGETSKFHNDGKTGTIPAARDFVEWSNTTPLDAFMLMGNTMQELYQNMRNGFDNHVRNSSGAMDFCEELRKKHNVKNWIDDKARPQKFEAGGKTIELVPTQVMSLYCLMKRQQAIDHIFGSGITAAPLPVLDKSRQKLTKGLYQRKLNSSHVMPTIGEVNAIIDTLTEEQKAAADAIQEFLNTTCAEWGNETSMKLYGYKKFGEKNYFPIKSSDAYLAESFDNKMNPSKLKNVGFTKNTVVHANNPIVIDDIFSVFTQHVNTMSMYNAMVPAITDFEKVYNFKVHGNGRQYGSVHASLQDAFGSGAIDYLTQFMKDVNQNYVRNRDHALANKLVANYKKAKIGANLRVLIQQPTAIARAGAVMNPLYILRAVPNAKSLPVLNKNSKKEMQEHCPIALWKSWGFYNTDIARDMRDIFLDKKNIADKLFMDMYGNADDLTWSIIWRAVKSEVEHNNKALEKGSDDYWRAVSDRFSYIVDRTQVVDSVFHRSQIMRRQDLFSKTLTSFMAEPTKTWNLLKTEYTLAHREFKDGKKSAAIKRVNRVMATHLFTAALTGSAAALIDALRGAGGEDDKKDFAEKWLSYSGQGFVDNANPLGLLPGLRDVVSLAQGYDVSRMDMAGFADLMNSVRYYWTSDTTASQYHAVKKTVGGISSVTGLPVGSLWRDLESVSKEIAKQFVPESRVDFIMAKLRYNMGNSKNRSKFAKIYAQAETAGDTDTMSEIRSELVKSEDDQKKWDTSVKTQHKNIAVNEAATLIRKGNESEARRIIQSYCNKYEWDFDKVWAKTQEEVNKRKSSFDKAYEAALNQLISK